VLDLDAIADAPEWLLNLVCVPEGEKRRRADDEEPAVETAITFTTTTVVSGSGDDAYYQAALEKECRAVSQAQNGTRNRKLNNAAYNLGQLVAGKGLQQGSVEGRLLSAAEACGLIKDDGKRSAEATIRSGLTAGAAV
jgi:hypothetical protein